MVLKWILAEVLTADEASCAEGYKADFLAVVSADDALDRSF